MGLGWIYKFYYIVMQGAIYSRSWSTCDILASNAVVASKQLPLFSKTSNYRTDDQHYNFTCDRNEKSSISSMLTCRLDSEEATTFLAQPHGGKPRLFGLHQVH